jgi:replicative DNA helicase
LNYGEMLLSKVIDSNDVQALNRFGVTENDFATEGERQVYRFITNYADKNRGNAPDYRTVVTECQDFNYRPNVADEYEYLVEQIKSHSIKVSIADLVNGTLPSTFKGKNGHDLADWLIDSIKDIKMRADFRTKIGTNLKHEKDKFLTEYRRRKAGESFKVWKSKFASINKHIGGYFSGNVYTWYGRSGRGKSVFTMEEVIESAVQGATVLIWAMEMSEFEWLARAYSSLSARQGIFTATINGVDYEAGFENKALLMGKLTDEWEEKFEEFLGKLNELVAGEIIIRAVDHADFYQRGVKQLEADIIQTKADVVLIDPIYYMDYEVNTSKTAGGDVANTSKKLRHIAGHTKAVIHVITQAEEVRDDTDEEGNRELRPPKRAEIKKTKAVLEDATNTFGIDTVDGRGIIEIGKGRNGGEGVQVEVLYLPSYGLVKEIEMDEVARQFAV